MLFQPRTLNQIRRKPGLVDPVKCRDVVCHLNAPVQEGALRPDAGKQHGEPMRSKARGTTFPQNEIGPITTTSVISGHVPSGISSKRTSTKVNTNASAMRQPCTTR